MTRILVICDDLWHPAEIIQKGICLLNKKNFQFDIISAAKDILTPELLKQYPAIIGCKGNHYTASNTAPWFEEGVTEVGPRQLREYVEHGGAYLSIHAGNSFSENSCPAESRFLTPCREYMEFIGNQFIGHPPRCPVDIHVTHPDHPIMNGITDFTVRDEHYQLELLASDIIPLFETSSVNGGTQPGGYVRKLGKGKLCVLTPGHTLSVWEHESFQQIICNALAWCLAL
ncbi:MAG: ThuA domain-containing protein [Eubacteriales bacterium]|nr:ThuA domain-containing protein [Eubacteriales bacterium]